MLGVMLQYLYDGCAIPIASVLMSVIYLVSMIALVRLVQQSAVTSMEIDPVCKMQADPKKTSLQQVYQGKTYYFCVPACQRSFAKTPEAFL